MNDDEIKKLYNEHKSLRKVSKISGYTKYKISKIINGEDFFRKKRIDLTKECAICKDKFITKVKTKTTCSETCRHEFKKEYLKGKNYNYANLVTWRIKRKQKCVDYKGGECINCGYNKCLSALEFHHLDPSEKEFGISAVSNTKFEKIKNELDKCILLCANCHREVHDGIIEI